MAPPSSWRARKPTRAPNIFAPGRRAVRDGHGRKAFAADSQASLITAIMSSQPPRLSSSSHGAAAARPPDSTPASRRIATTASRPAHDAAASASLDCRRGSQVGHRPPVTPGGKHASASPGRWLPRHWPLQLGLVSRRCAPCPPLPAASRAAVPCSFPTRSDWPVPKSHPTVRASCSAASTRLARSSSGYAPSIQHGHPALGHRERHPAVLVARRPLRRVLRDKKLGKRIEATGGGAPSPSSDIDAWGHVGAGRRHPGERPSGPILRLPGAGGPAAP